MNITKKNTSYIAIFALCIFVIIFFFLKIEIKIVNTAPLHEDTAKWVNALVDNTPLPEFESIVKHAMQSELDYAVSLYAHNYKTNYVRVLVKYYDTNKLAYTLEKMKKNDMSDAVDLVEFILDD